MRKPDKTKATASGSYFKLVSAFPLRVVRNSADRQAALAVLYDLASRKGSADTGRRDYAAALRALVDLYDREAMEKQLSKGTPLQRLKVLMQHGGTTPRDLERIFGSSRALVSLVLHGRRELSKANIRALARHFKVSTDHFL